MSDPSHELEPEHVEIYEDLSYIEHPMRVMDRREQVLKNKVIPLVLVVWKNHSIEEATWEMEDEIREKYPFLFLS